jgi:hypothetical protein
MDMNRSLCLALVFAAAAALPLQAQGTFSQSVDSVTITPGNTIACNTGAPNFSTGQNSYWRQYNIINEGVVQNVDITAVTFGVETALGGTAGTSTTVTINLYNENAPTLGTITPANLLLVHTQTFSVPDGGGQLFNVPLTVPVSFIVTDTIVVEYSFPNQIAATGSCFGASNAFGETAPCFFSSSTCGLPNPVTFPMVNPAFTTIHMILDLDWVPSGTTLTYPGSSEDLQLRTAVSLANPPLGGLANDIKTCIAGDVLQVVVESTGGTFQLFPHVLVGELFTTGMPPIGPAAPFDTIHFNPTSPSAFALIVGTTLTPLGFFSVINPGGNLYIYTVPPGLSGFSVLIQDLVPTPIAANGFFAVTDGHEFQIL